MASKMAALQALLVLLWMCLAVVTACPAQCTCGPYTNRHSDKDLYVDCSGRGLDTIPASLPENTKSLNMANNRLTNIDRSALSYLNLEEINLSGNSIQEVPRRAFGIKGRCTFKDLDHRMNYRQRVVHGEWHIHDFMNVSWPCAIDLRNNPIFRIEENAFGGSHNFTILLGQSSSNLTIDSAAFGNTANIIGLHISSVPTLTLSHGSFIKMNTVYWIIINKTEILLKGPPFIRETSTDVRWFRISNSIIPKLRNEDLEITMDVETDCYVKAYPYPTGPSGTTRRYRSYIEKGGVEIVNNTLPVLPANLFGRSNLGGVFFKDNKIAGFFHDVFARKHRYHYADICILRFAGNEFPNIPSGTFRSLKNVTFLSIYGGNYSSIDADAFIYSSDIGSLSIGVSSHQEYDPVVIKTRAFAGINGVKDFHIYGVDHEKEGGKAGLLLQPNAFNSLRNVDYMTVSLYDNMEQLPNFLFRGLTVKQNLKVRARELTKIDPTAFGIKSSGTEIKRLSIDGLQNIPCSCETSNLNMNLKDTVGSVHGLTCTSITDSGFIYQTTELDAACSACSLRFSLILIFVTSVLLTL